MQNVEIKNDKPLLQQHNVSGSYKILDKDGVEMPDHWSTPTDANNVLAEGVRPFDDLIKEIEFDGEKFIPAQKIAALCFNYNEKAVKNKAKMWVNNSYDYTMWYVFQTNILKPKKHQCSIGISRNFDISTYHRIGDEEPKSNVGMPPSNQVEIVKNLIRWGFVAFR